MFSVITGKALGNLWNRELSYSIKIQISQFWTRQMLSPSKFYALRTSHTHSDNMVRSHKRPLITTEHRLKYKQPLLQGYRAVKRNSNDKQSISTTDSKYWLSYWENTIYSRNLRWPGGRDSSVGIATRYGLDGPGIESLWGRDFPHPSRPALGPTQPPVQWIPGISRG